MYNGKQLAYKDINELCIWFHGCIKRYVTMCTHSIICNKKGRMMIDDTKNYVEENYPGAKVRYGDTDSVMVEFDVGERKGEDAIKV